MRELDGRANPEKSMRGSRGPQHLVDPHQFALQVWFAQADATSVAFSINGPLAVTVAPR